MAIDNPFAFIGKTVDDDVTQEEISKNFPSTWQGSSHICMCEAVHAKVPCTQLLSVGVRRLAGGNQGSNQASLQDDQHVPT